MSGHKKVTISCIDSSNAFKISKKIDDGDNSIDKNILSQGIDKLFNKSDIKEKLYIYCAKVYDNENILHKKNVLDNFNSSLLRFGWTPICVNPKNFIIFKEDNTKDGKEINHNMSQTIKSIYQEVTCTTMYLQDLLDKYSYDEGFEDSDIDVNMIIYNDTYNFMLDHLMNLYPHVRFNIITTEDKFAYFDKVFESRCKIFDIDYVMKVENTAEKVL